MPIGVNLSRKWSSEMRATHRQFGHIGLPSQYIYSALVVFCSTSFLREADFVWHCGSSKYVGGDICIL